MDRNDHKPSSQGTYQPYSDCQRAEYAKPWKKPASTVTQADTRTEESKRTSGGDWNKAGTKERQV
jgi:hypothetical protein